MKIKKSIKGEIFNYHVHFILDSMQASVRYGMGYEAQICTISDDFKYVILTDWEEFTHYIDGVYYPVKKLKLNKCQQLEAIDYNKNFKHE